LPRRWKPGPRIPARERLEQRYAWTDNADGEFVIYVQDPDLLFDDDGVAQTGYLEFGSGDNVHLVVNPRKSRHSSVIMLTNLNEKELDTLQELINLAFEWARPVVQLRDREARERMESGDDIDSRNYRQVPQLIVRRRPVGEHGEGVRDGSPDVSGVGGSAAEDPVRGSDAPSGGTGFEESGMAWDPEKDGISEDDEATYYESTEFGNLGEDPGSAGGVQVPATTTTPAPSYPRPPAVPTPPDPGL
jgi:hypothetical protein